MYWYWFETVNNVGDGGGVMVVAEMKKDNFFCTQQNILPEKVCKLQQI